MRPTLSEKSQAAIQRALDAALILCALGSLALFVVLTGWPLTVAQQALAHVLINIVLGVFVAQEAVRLLVHPRPGALLRKRKLEATLAALVLLESLLSRLAADWLRALVPGARAGSLMLFVLAFSQLTLVGLAALRGLRGIPALAGRKLAPGGAFLLSFAALISIGTLLLKMPRATTAGIAWVDALFTATSAVCVTGLTVLDIAGDFTRQGQFVIMCLLQAGGLGIMTLTYFFAHFLSGGGMSFRSRIALQDLLSEDNLGQIGAALGIIIGFTFSFELAGAAAIYFSLDEAAVAAIAAAGDGGLGVGGSRLFFSLFHSVASFCNAGFSVMPGGLSNAALRGNVSLLAPVMLLVTAGGIGVPVVKNLWQMAAAAARRRFGLRGGGAAAAAPRLTTNSRVVLVTSFVLTFGGAAAVWLTEFVLGNGDSAGLPSWLAALFQSVASRSCGFSVSDTRLLAPATMVIVMFLMFIGGSPVSAAGGVKTSTLAVAALAVRRVLLGRADVEAFGRRVSNETADRALAVISLAGMFFAVMLVAVCALHPGLPTMDVAFEVMSAVSTTGLARGIAPQLCPAAKCVMVVGMFVGRVGVLMTLLSFMPRRPQPSFRLAEGGIVIT